MSAARWASSYKVLAEEFSILLSQTYARTHTQSQVYTVLQADNFES